jgi:hypothetical protein
MWIAAFLFLRIVPGTDQAAMEEVSGLQLNQVLGFL